METRYQREEGRLHMHRLLVSVALGVTIGGVIGTLRVLSIF
jgi:hypothetical protein